MNWTRELDCIQPNGEHLRVERWVYDGVRNGTVRDPMLVRIVRNAVEIRPAGWPRTPAPTPSPAPEGVRS